MEREEAKKELREEESFRSKVNGEISLSKGFFTFYASSSVAPAEDKASSDKWEAEYFPTAKMPRRIFEQKGQDILKIFTSLASNSLEA